MSAQSKQVLLIEDNPGDVDLVRLRLVESNSKRAVPFEVSSADRLSTGLTALTAERPAVVLLDLYLPDSQGAATVHAVLSHAVGVPVVVISARDDDDLVSMALQCGAQDYLVKGAFDSKQLGRTLGCAIERQALITALGANWKEPLKCKEELLSPILHDLRGVLTSIDHSVTAAFDDFVAPVDAGQRVHLDTILRSVNHLRSMIDQMEATRAESDNGTAPEGRSRLHGGEDAGGNATIRSDGQM